jgi:hypothetical protein
MHTLLGKIMEHAQRITQHFVKCLKQPISHTKHKIPYFIPKHHHILHKRLQVSLRSQIWNVKYKQRVVYVLHE